MTTLYDDPFLSLPSEGSILEKPSSGIGMAPKPSMNDSLRDEYSKMSRGQEIFARIGEFAHRLAEAKGGTRELGAAAETADLEFRTALDSDLNAPEAVGALFTFIGQGNAELDRKGSELPMLERAREVFALMMKVLDLEPRAMRFVVSASSVDPEPVAASGLSERELEQVGWAVSKLRDRIVARQNRDFALSDAIRGEVEGQGFAVKDTAQGTVLERYH